MNTPPEDHHEEDQPFGIPEVDSHDVLRDDVNVASLPPIGDTPPRLAIDTARPQPSIDLMSAQAEYIVAMTNYIHDPDLKALLKAQEAFINAQAGYIHLADDRLLAEVQEQIIGVQLRTLRKLGAV